MIESGISKDMIQLQYILEFSEKFWYIIEIFHQALH